MKILAYVCVVTFFAWNAYAQTITKVDGSRVTLKGDFSDVKRGQSVNFLDSSLVVKATGFVENISPQGRMAVVHINSGSVTKADTVEIGGSEKSEKIEKVERAEKETASQTRHRDRESDVQLTPEEREILSRGEISDTSYIIGGIFGTWPLGLGIGHAIQGRYADKGWIFTVGELGSAALIVSGIQDCTYHYAFYDFGGTGCTTNGLFTIGVVAFVGFRIWEIVDLWATPPELNRRYREIKNRVNTRAFSPLIVPTKESLLLGLQYRF